MPAEIIAVGTEIASGAKLDTNSQWLSLRLGEVGIPVRYHTTVADDFDANVEVFRTALQRAEIVLVTGGLGPTQDDLTRQALAQALGVDLVLDDPSLHAIEEMFASRGRPMSASNRLQAMFPRGSSPLPNPVGTAPGIWCSLLRAGEAPAHLAAMPGVPSEMHRMFREQVEPRLTGHSVIRRAVVNCFGFGEAQTEELLGDLTRRGADPEVGITAHEATISLRIIAQGIRQTDCDAKIEGVRRLLAERLGDTIFGVDDEEPEHVVVRELAQRGATVGVCESATRGNLSERLMRVEGGERVLRGGLVLPADAVFSALLDGVPSPPSALNAATGSALAVQLAQAARRRFHTAYGLGVTSLGEVALGGGRTVACAWVAVADGEHTHAAEARSTGNPAIFAPRTSKIALDLLRRRLLGLRPSLDS
jgi:nicotinamide-nucleotide amidase